MKKKINMKALAAELNLSTATISKALKNSHDISSETKKRVIGDETEVLGVRYT